MSKDCRAFTVPTWEWRQPVAPDPGELDNRKSSEELQHERVKKLFPALKSSLLY